MITNFGFKSKKNVQNIIDVNKDIFGNERFRPYQEDIIKTIMDNKDVFVIMPTGGGKTLCYTLPAILSQGVTVVISPLISLIDDQVSSLLQNNCGGIPAAYLTSTCTVSMTQSVVNDLKRAQQGKEPYLKLLYLTPENIINKISTKSLLTMLYRNDFLARFIVDEAHCVSSWGHDFRKDYAKLTQLKEWFSDVPIVALTATARKKVADDTLKILNIKNCHQFNAGFDRPNLLFEVREKPQSMNDSLKLVLEYIQQPHNVGVTGIVYCMTKKECESTADFLRDNDIKADFYHAGQSNTDRKCVQAAWLSGTIHVVCATIAYGMGIDKANVRYVLHLSIAKSLEGYYQEAGRAGRDGKNSECIMYYKETDINSLARIMMKPPARTLAKKDRDMLEEIQEYCEEKLQCRRKIIYEKFLDSSSKLKSKFQNCIDKCDNCLIKSGKPRLIPTVSTIDNKHNTTSKSSVPSASFQKASSLIKSSSTSSTSSLKTALTLFTKSKSLPSSSTVSNKRNIVSVYDDDFDDDDDDDNNNNNNSNFKRKI